MADMYPEKQQQPQQAYPGAYAQPGGYQQQGYYQPQPQQPYQQPQQGYPAAQQQQQPPPYYSGAPPAAQGYNTYGQQPIVGVVAYPQQQPQPVYVATPLQPQPYNDSDTTVAMVIFIAGFLCCPIWCAGFGYFRSANPRARTFARLSLGMLVCSVVFLCIYLIVIFAVIGGGSATCVRQYSGSSCFSASSSCRMCVLSQYSSGTCQAIGDYCVGTAYSSMYSYCSAFSVDNCPSDCTTNSWGCTA